VNGAERIRAAVEGRRPDRVPVMLHNFLVAADEAGFTQAQFRSDPGAIVESFTRAVERYGYDGVLVDVDTTILAGAAGVALSFPENDPATAASPLLTCLEDAARLRPARVESHGPAMVLLEAVRRLADAFRGQVYVRGNCDQAPFSLATMVRGAAELMMDLCDEANAAAVQDLLDYCTGITMQMIRLMAETGCDMVSNGDSPAGPDLISPAHYVRWALPGERLAAAEARARGLPYTLHICGDTTRILPRMVETAADCLELDYQTDPAAARAALAGRVTFIGNLDPSGVLRFGTPGDVERATVALLREFSGTPRFILNAGCAIPRGTPPANIHAMIAAARSIR
jgi:MtaA/CmuA family methyltransferase